MEGSQEVKKENKERSNKGQMKIAGGQKLKDGELGGSVLSRATWHRGQRSTVANLFGVVGGTSAEMGRN